MIISAKAGKVLTVGLMLSVSSVTLLVADKVVAETTEAWVGEAEDLRAERGFRSGPILPENITFAQRLYGVVSLFGGLESEDFKLSSTRGGDVLHAIVAEGQSAELVWRAEATTSGRIFIGIVDLWNENLTGEETLAVYHNNYLVGRFSLGLAHRMEQRYAFPYSWTLADQRKDVPMELSFEEVNRVFRYGFTMPDRRKFVEGDVLRVVAESPGYYPIMDVSLVPKDDTMRHLDHAILHAENRLWRHGRHEGQVQIAWVTRLPSRSFVRIADQPEAVVDERAEIVSAGDAYAENHQVFVPAPASGESFHYQILAESNEGARVVSDVIEFSTPAPAPQTSSGETDLAFVDPPPGAPAPAYVPLPFPKGELNDVAALRVIDAESGQPLPAQPRIVASYPDGSVMWARLDFTAQPGAAYRVAWGPELPQAEAVAALSVEQSDAAVHVRGPLGEVAFSPSAPAGLETLRVTPVDGPAYDVAAGDMPLYFTGTEGQRYLAGPPHDLRIEQAGHELVTVRAEGHFHDGETPFFHYIARWTLRANEPGIDLEITIGNDLPDTIERMYDPNKQITHFREFVFELPLPEGNDGGLQAVTPEGWLGFPPGDWLSLFQRDENTLRVSDDGQTAEQIEQRLEGSFAVGEGSATLGVRIEKFWQNYPKGVSVTDGRLAIGILPEFEPDDYPEEPYELYTRLFFYTKNGEYRIMHGVQRTHRLSLRFGPSASASTVETSASFFAKMLMPDKAFTAEAGPFGSLRPEDGRFQAFNDWMRLARQHILERRELNREYGWLNFGDWWGERGSNWGNLEYDHAQSCAMEFLRTYDREWFEIGWEAANHQADVDTVGYGRNAGLQVMHAMAHTGREYFHADGETWHSIRDRTGLSRAGYHQAFHAGHMWIGGIAGYHALTADAWLGEVANLFGQTRGRAITFNTSPAAHRGLNLIAFASLYATTRDPFYLNAMRIVRDRYDAIVDPLTGSVHGKLYAQNTIDAQHREAFAFYLDMLPEDQRMEGVFLRSMKAVDLGLWDDEVKGIVTEHHGWWPNRRDSIKWTFAFAQTAVMTGESRWRERLMSKLQDGMTRLPGGGRSMQALTSALQFASLLPAALERLDIEDIEPREVSPEVLEARNKAGRGGAEEQLSTPDETDETDESEQTPDSGAFRLDRWDDDTLVTQTLRPDNPLLALSSRIEGGSAPFPDQRVIVAEGETPIVEAGFIIVETNGEAKQVSTGRYRLGIAAWSGSSRHGNNRSAVSFGLFQTPATDTEQLRVTPENDNLLLGVRLGNRQHLYTSEVDDAAEADHLMLVWRSLDGEVMSQTVPISESDPLVLPFPRYPHRHEAGPISLEMEVANGTLVARVMDCGPEEPVVLLQTSSQAIPSDTKGYFGVTLTAEATPGQSVSTAIGRLDVEP